MTTRKLIASCGFWREVLLRQGFCGGGGGEDYWYEHEQCISMDFGAGISNAQPMKKIVEVQLVQIFSRYG